jgi:hypothetical protein
MDERNGQGRVVLIFLVVMGLTAAAAVPFMPQPRSAAEEPETAVLPEEETEKAEAPAPPRVVRTKPRSTRTTKWEGGGETTHESGSGVGAPGRWYCPRCNRTLALRSKRPSLMICPCGETYRNGVSAPRH